MLKTFSLLLLFPLLFVLGCASKPASASVAKGGGSPFLLSLPTEKGLVFIGVSGRRSNPKETIQFALEDAARRVAVFHQVSGEYASEIEIGSGAFDYINNVYSALHYDEEGSVRYVDALQYDPDTDAIEMENAFVIRVTYPAALPAPLQYRPAHSGVDRKPDWVDNPPLEIAGYEVGVGFANRHSSFADTCTVSYRNAVLAVIRNLNMISKSKDMMYQGTGTFDYETSNNNIMYAYGSLVNFYVLDTWLDPKNKSVWTLAIAKKTE